MDNVFKVLDLYCGGGGAAEGYRRAAKAAGYRIHITGVDIEPQPEYCGDEFIQRDAIAYALEHGHGHDFIHASAPCQFASTITPDDARLNHVNLIPATRRALLKSRKPYVMENVVTMEKVGPMRRDLMLCGEMFGLQVVRHRIFEAGGFLPQRLRHVEHAGPTKNSGRPAKGTVATSEGHYYAVYGTGGGKGTTEEWGKAMDIDWITDRHTMAEAIPPAYTQYIANEFLRVPIIAEDIRSGYRA